MHYHFSLLFLLIICIIPKSNSVGNFFLCVDSLMWITPVFMFNVINEFLFNIFLRNKFCHNTVLFFNCVSCNCMFQFAKLNPYYQFILAVIYVVMGGLEVLRLFLGYSGNLSEKVW